MCPDFEKYEETDMISIEELNSAIWDLVINDYIRDPRFKKVSWCFHLNTFLDHWTLLTHYFQFIRKTRMTTSISSEAFEKKPRKLENER